MLVFGGRLLQDAGPSDRSPETVRQAQYTEAELSTSLGVLPGQEQNSLEPKVVLYI